MANGPRLKRQGGFKSTGGLDSLMQLLQVGSGVAQSVQQNRNKRDDYDLKMIGILAGNYESEYNSSILDENIKAVEAYKNKKMNNMSNNAFETYDVVYNQMKNQQNRNLQFKTDMSALDSLSDNAGNWATDLYENWELKTPQEQDALIASGAKDSFGVPYSKNYSEAKKKDFLKISKKWAEARDKMGQYDSRRMTAFHTSKMANLEMIVDGALDFYGDGQMSKLEITTIKNAVKSGNAKPIQDLMQTQARQEGNATTVLFNELEESKKLIGTTQQALKDKRFTVPYKNVKNLLDTTGGMRETLPDYIGLDDNDDYTIDLSDGSPLANQYKRMLETNLVEEQEKLTNKMPTYEKITGKNYADMFDLSNDFLGIPETVPPPPGGGKGTPKVGEGKTQSDATQILKNYTDYSSNIENLKPGARNSVEPIIKRRTDDLNNYIELIDNIKIGEGLAIGNKALEAFAKEKNLKLEDAKEFLKFYKQKFPKSQDATHEYVVEESMRGLRQILEVEEGKDGRYDRNSYQYISNAPLSFEELNKIEKIFNADKANYDKILENKKILENAKETKTPEYVNLLKQEAKFLQKWMGGTEREGGRKMQGEFVNPYTEEFSKIEGNYFGAGIWGAGNPGKIKGMADALNSSLSFYNDFLKSQSDEKSKKLGAIINQSSVK